MHLCAHLRENAHKGVCKGHLVCFTRRDSSPLVRLSGEQLSFFRMDKKGWKRLSYPNEAVVMYTPIGP
jgi:hypothetical protein